MTGIYVVLAFVGGMVVGFLLALWAVNGAAGPRF